MFCSHCGKQIPDKASYCPYCGAPAFQEKADTKKKRRFLPWILAVIGILILGSGAVLLIHSIENRRETKEESVAEPRSKSTKETEDETEEAEDISIDDILIAQCVNLAKIVAERAGEAKVFRLPMEILPIADSFTSLKAMPEKISWLTADDFDIADMVDPDELAEMDLDMELVKTYFFTSLPSIVNGRFESSSFMAASSALSSSQTIRLPQEMDCARLYLLEYKEEEILFVSAVPVGNRDIRLTATPSNKSCLEMLSDMLSEAGLDYSDEIDAEAVSEAVKTGKKYSCTAKPTLKKADENYFITAAEDILKRVAGVESERCELFTGDSDVIDVIDSIIDASAFSYGYGVYQADTEGLYAYLQDTAFENGLSSADIDDIAKLVETSGYLPVLVNNFLMQITATMGSTHIAAQSVLSSIMNINFTSADQPAVRVLPYGFDGIYFVKAYLNSEYYALIAFCDAGNGFMSEQIIFLPYEDLIDELLRGVGAERR